MDCRKRQREVFPAEGASRQKIPKNTAGIVDLRSFLGIAAASNDTSNGTKVLPSSKIGPTRRRPKAASKRTKNGDVSSVITTNFQPVADKTKTSDVKENTGDDVTANPAKAKNLQEVTVENTIPPCQNSSRRTKSTTISGNSQKSNKASESPDAITSVPQPINANISECSTRRQTIGRSCRYYSRCSSLPPTVSKVGHSIEKVRCQYSDDLLSQKVSEARRLGTKHDYFAAFRGCPHGSRVSYRTRDEIVKYFIETGTCIKSPISPFSIHMAISIFDRYMSYLAESGSDEVKEQVARNLEVISGACLHLASKVEDPWCLCLGDICRSFEGGVVTRPSQVIQWEIHLIRDFNFDINCPTILDFAHLMFQKASEEICATEEELSKLWRKTSDCAYQAVTTHHLLGIPSHVLAAASLLVAITLNKSNGETRISLLPKTVRQLLGPMDREELKLAACTIQELLEDKVKQRSLTFRHQRPNSSSCDETNSIGSTSSQIVKTPRISNAPLESDPPQKGEPNSKKLGQTASTQAPSSVETNTQEELSLSQDDLLSDELNDSTEARSFFSQDDSSQQNDISSHKEELCSHW